METRHDITPPAFKPLELKIFSDLSHLLHYLIIPHTFWKSTFYKSMGADPPPLSNPRINTVFNDILNELINAINELSLYQMTKL